MPCTKIMFVKYAVRQSRFWLSKSVEEANVGYVSYDKKQNEIDVQLSIAPSAGLDNGKQNTGAVCLPFMWSVWLEWIKKLRKTTILFFETYEKCLSCLV